VIEAAASSTSLPEIVVPADAFEIAAESMGAFFEPISRVDRHTVWKVLRCWK
jgi:hypothetical protein